MNMYVILNQATVHQTPVTTIQTHTVFTHAYKYLKK